MIIIQHTLQQVIEMDSILQKQIDSLLKLQLFAKVFTLKSTVNFIPASKHQALKESYSTLNWYLLNAPFMQLTSTELDNFIKEFQKDLELDDELELPEYLLDSYNRLKNNYTQRLAQIEQAQTNFDEQNYLITSDLAFHRTIAHRGSVGVIVLSGIAVACAAPYMIESWLQCAAWIGISGLGYPVLKNRLSKNNIHAQEKIRDEAVDQADELYGKNNNSILSEIKRQENLTNETRPALSPRASSVAVTQQPASFDNNHHLLFRPPSLVTSSSAYSSEDEDSQDYELIDRSEVNSPLGLRR